MWRIWPTAAILVRSLEGWRRIPQGTIVVPQLPLPFLCASKEAGTRHFLTYQVGIVNGCYAQLPVVCFSSFHFISNQLPNTPGDCTFIKKIRLLHHKALGLHSPNPEFQASLPGGALWQPADSSGSADAFAFEKQLWPREVQRQKPQCS